MCFAWFKKKKSAYKGDFSSNRTCNLECIWHMHDQFIWAIKWSWESFWWPAMQWCIWVTRQMWPHRFGLNYSNSHHTFCKLIFDQKTFMVWLTNRIKYIDWERIFHTLISSWFNWCFHYLWDKIYFLCYFQSILHPCFFACVNWPEHPKPQGKNRLQLITAANISQIPEEWHVKW